MNILDFIKQGGKVKAATGDDVTINSISPTATHCINGTIHSKVVDFQMSWDEDGFPENLPSTHGLNLLAVLPEVKYNVVNTKRLREATSIEDLQ